MNLAELFTRYVPITSDYPEEGVVFLGFEVLKLDLKRRGPLAEQILGELYQDVAPRYPQVLLCDRSARKYGRALAKRLGIEAAVFGKGGALPKDIEAIVKRANTAEGEKPQAVVFEHKVLRGLGARNMSAVAAHFVDAKHVVCLVSADDGGQALIAKSGMTFSALTSWDSSGFSLGPRAAVPERGVKVRYDTALGGTDART